MQAIHEAGYRVSISGTAADELFSGYFDHHLLYLAAVRDDPALHGASVANWEREIKPIVRNPFLAEPRPVRRRTRRSATTSTWAPTSSPSYLHRAVRRAVLRAAVRPRRAAQPDAQRAVRRGRPGDPARGRPQRHVLLDREPLAVPRPRAVRVHADDPDAAPGPRRPRQGRAARVDARHRPRPRSSTTRARSASTRRSTRCSTPTTPRCAPSCSTRRARSGTSCAARRSRTMLEPRLPAQLSESKFLFNFVTREDVPGGGRRRIKLNRVEWLDGR